jgi:DNA-binding response OmpR family regulator
VSFLCGTVLILDFETARASLVARRLESECCIVTVAKRLDDALVRVAIAEPDLVIVTFGTTSSPHSTITTLRALAPHIEILFTGPLLNEHDARVLDDGASYLPTISRSRIEAIINGRRS